MRIYAIKCQKVVGVKGPFDVPQYVDAIDFVTELPDKKWGHEIVGFLDLQKPKESHDE